MMCFVWFWLWYFFFHILCMPFKNTGSLHWSIYNYNGSFWKFPVFLYLDCIARTIFKNSSFYVCHISKLLELIIFINEFRLSCGHSSWVHSSGFTSRMLHGYGGHSKGIKQAMQGLWLIASKMADLISCGHIQCSTPLPTLTCTDYTNLCSRCQCSELRIIWLILSLIVLVRRE